MQPSDKQEFATVQRPDRWQAMTGITLGILTLAGLLSLLGRWGYDDPYITFRYARNLLAGHGFVYNVGQRTLSTTAPLYAILLAGLGYLWPDPSGQGLPALSNALSAASVLGSATLLLTWALRRGQKATGMIAAVLLSLFPLLLTTLGAEIGLYLLLIMAGFSAYDRSRLNLAAVALALAAMVRPDGLLAAVALALYHLWRCLRAGSRADCRLAVPWLPVALYIVLVGAWYGGLWLYFGAPWPVTLLVKQQQGQMAISTRFGAGFVDLVRRLGRQPLYRLHGALAVVGLGRVAVKERHWALLLLWTALYFLAYTLLGVSRYFWYYAPLVPAFVVLVAEGAVALLRLIVRLRAPQTLSAGLTGLLLIALLAPLLSGTLGAAWRSDPRLKPYREIGQWLALNTPPQATVGALEVGIIGYYAQRPMVDFAGLIQPEVARRFTADSTYQESAAWAIQNYRPDYVVLHGNGFSYPAESDWFQAAYLPVRQFADQDSLWLTLYRRRTNP